MSESANQNHSLIRLFADSLIPVLCLKNYNIRRVWIGLIALLFWLGAPFDDLYAGTVRGTIITTATEKPVRPPRYYLVVTNFFRYCPPGTYEEQKYQIGGFFDTFLYAYFGALLV